MRGSQKPPDRTLGVIDRGRAKGRRAGRFLLLGSASIDLLRQSSATLAGRIAHIELTPLLAIRSGEVDAVVVSCERRH